MEQIGLVGKKNSSTLFWIQPITVFNVLYRLTDYYEDFRNYDAKDKLIKLPGLPPLRVCLVGLNVLENVFQINSFSSNLRKMTSLQNLRKIFSKTLFQLQITITFFVERINLFCPYPQIRPPTTTTTPQKNTFKAFKSMKRQIEMLNIKENPK
ncbi:hypothetical protein H5410_004532, partial [Solanum commersonii]